MDTAFELPPFEGIHEAIADVRAYGIKEGKEKLIALRRNGTRVFEVNGTNQRVDGPESYCGKLQDVLLVHCHPGLTTELSDADFTCIMGYDAWGNLAACCDDDTISWSQGFKAPRDGFMLEFMILPAVHQLSQEIVSEVAQREDPTITTDKAFQQWLNTWKDKNDERYVVLAHKMNAYLARVGALKDYHVQLGPKARAILTRWDAL